MRNETARREIESLDYYLQNYTDDYSEESHTAMMMAVKALEQEPCEDAISRQKMLDGLASIAKAKARSDAQKALMGRVMFFTEKLPSVNPQKPICPSAGVDCEDYPAYEKKSEWQQDHEILKAYSDGANDVLDHVRAEIDAARFLDKDKKLFKNANASGLEVAMDIIDKFMAESEEKNEVSVSDKSNP